MPHRQSGIRFPPRRTPEGQRISDLPAEKAHAYISQQDTGTSTAPSAPAAAAAALPEQGTDVISPTFSRAATITVLQQLPPRRELTDKEMEIINLGGASP
eukprot:jgi/Chrzof1/1185/Cz01g43250.t1